MTIRKFVVNTCAYNYQDKSAENNAGLPFFSQKNMSLIFQILKKKFNFKINENQVTLKN